MEDKPWCRVVDRWFKGLTMWHLKYDHKPDADGWDRDDGWFDLYDELVDGLSKHLNLVDQYRIIKALNLEAPWLDDHTANQLHLLSTRDRLRASRFLTQGQKALSKSLKNLKG